MTLRELAKEIGCSRATLDRVINHREGVSDRRRREILEQIEELGYKPNKIGKMLSKQNRTVIGVILCMDNTPMDNPLFDIIYKGMQEAARELEQNGVTFAFRHIESGRASEQVRVIEELVTEQGVSGIVISIEEKSEELFETIRYHMSRGVRFLSYFNISGAQNMNFKFPYELGTGQKREGSVAAGLMGRFLGGRGKVALISGLEKNQVHQIRVDSAGECLSKLYPDIEVLPVFRNSFPGNKVEELVEHLLKEHPDLSGIIASCGYVGTLTRKIRERGKKDQISIIVYDCTRQAESDLENGDCDAVIGVDLKRLGYKTIMAVNELVFQNEVSEDVRFLPLQILLKESVMPL